MDSFDDAEEICGRYLEALLREAQIQSAAVRELGAEVVTIYLGGAPPRLFLKSRLGHW